MAGPARLYTPAEAAAISGLALQGRQQRHRQAHVDVPRPAAPAGRRAGRRYLTTTHLLCLRLEHGLVGCLPVDLSQGLFREVAAKPQAKRLDADDLLSVNLTEARRQVEARVRLLEEAERLIHSDKDSLAGEPVFKDTRISVYGLVTMLDAGATAADVMAGTPKLNTHKIDLARLWVAAHPRRGRPKRLADYGFSLKSTTRRSLPPIHWPRR